MASWDRVKTGYRVRWREWDHAQARRRGRSRTVRTARARDKLLAEVQYIESLGRHWSGNAERAAPLGVAIAAYLDHREHVAGKAASTVRREETELGQLLGVAKVLFGREPTVSVLSPPLLEAYVAHQRQRGVTASIVTRTQTVERMWAWVASAQQFRAHTPPPNPKPLSDALEAAPTPRKPAATWAEMDSAVQAARRRRKGSKWYGTLLTLARYTGLRCGQIMKLEWRDFDLDRALLTIRPELGKTRQERRGRTIPVSKHLVAYLARLGRRDGHVVACPRTEREPHWRTLNLIYEQSGLRRELWEGADGRRGRKMHLFRHGLATGLIAAGAQDHLVRMLLGHATGGMTVDAYTDMALVEDRLREVVALIPAVGEGADVHILRARG